MDFKLVPIDGAAEWEPEGQQQCAADVVHSPEAPVDQRHSALGYTAAAHDVARS
jgi:hypothetical protein